MVRKFFFIQIGSSATTGGAAQHFKKVRELGQSSPQMTFYCDLGTVILNRSRQKNVFVPISRLANRNLLYLIGAGVNFGIFVYLLLKIRLSCSDKPIIWLHGKELRLCRLVRPIIASKSIILDIRDEKNIPLRADIEYLRCCLYCSEGIRDKIGDYSLDCLPLSVFFDKKLFLSNLRRSKRVKFVIPHGIDDAKNSGSVFDFLLSNPKADFYLDIYGRLRSSVSARILNDPRLRIRGVVSQNEIIERATLSDTFLLLLGKADGLPRSAIEWLGAGGVVMSTQNIAELEGIPNVVFETDTRKLLDLAILRVKKLGGENLLSSCVERFFDNGRFEREFSVIIELTARSAPSQP